MLIQKQLEAHKMLDFEWVAHNRVRALNQGFQNGLLAVTLLRDHIVASGGVDAAEFRAFAGSLLLRNPGVQTLMWVPRIRSPDGSEQLPARYVAPEDADAIPAGFDLSKMDSVAPTLTRAREQGRIVASGRIAYESSQGGVEYGFMAASPVFDVAAPTQMIDRRDTDPVGFVVAFYRFSALINNAISILEPRGVELLVLDDSMAGGERFQYFYSSRVTPSSIGPDDVEAWLKDTSEPKFVDHVQLADRWLTIVCRRTVGFRSAEAFREGPWMVLITGLLFTVLLSFYLARIRENIRQRSAMEQRLLEREELFRQMTETVDEAFWATSADTERFLYLSPAYGTILGVPEAVGQTSLLDAVHPDDRGALEEALRRTGREGVETEKVHRIRRADGTLRWVRTRGFAVRDANGRIYRLVGFVEDITERKLADEALRESESKLRDLFRHSPDIIMTVNAAGTILLMNRSVPALPAERAIGRSCLALMPRDFRKWFRKALKAVFAKATTRQFQYSADDGTYWEGRVAPIRGSDGQVTAAMVIAGDVTEKRNLEAQALHNARLASIGVLAAGVAHEINNPNNAIQFNASLVSRAWKDVAPILREYYEEHGDFALGGLPFSEARESFNRLLSEITANSDRIRRIVQNLKYMARQDAGDRNESVDIQQILEATVMILHNQIQKHTDDFTLEVSEGLPLVQGNSQQIEQVFLNTILNALQALSDRSKGVHVRAEFAADENEIRITIRDEGCGISERDLGRLTEPFFTTRTDTGGTGLGLSICRSIIEKHGGTIGFASRLGEGTTVTITFPPIH
jgi:PAS domain S-box-containing protein